MTKTVNERPKMKDDFLEGALFPASFFYAKPKQVPVAKKDVVPSAASSVTRNVNKAPKDPAKAKKDDFIQAWDFPVNLFSAKPKPPKKATTLEQPKAQAPQTTHHREAKHEKHDSLLDALGERFFVNIFRSDK